MNPTSAELLNIQNNRRRVLADKHAADERMRLAHVKLTEQFHDPERYRFIKDAALVQIQKWEDGQLCHHSYVARWRDILNSDLATCISRIVEQSDEGLALRQNTPFSGYLGLR